MAKQAGEKKSYLVVILFMIALAAFSNEMKELNQIQGLPLDASRLMAAWSDVVIPTVNASSSTVPTSCIQNFNLQTSSRSDEFRWNGVVAQGQSIEIQGINGDIVAEPSNGPEVQVVATKRSRRSDINLVQIKVVPHAGGVTICALYPNEDGQYRNCGPSEDNDKDQGSGNVRNNDVEVRFAVRVPQRVNFVGKTINGDVSATSLTGNVVSKTINGSVNISTTGYAEAKTINGQISARFTDGNWPSSLSFKTINGEINLDLPANLSAAVDAQTLNGSITSDFPLNVIDLKGKKSVRGTIGSGGRDLILRTLNGSIKIRIAG